MIGFTISYHRVSSGIYVDVRLFLLLYSLYVVLALRTEAVVSFGEVQSFGRFSRVSIWRSGEVI